MSEEYTQTAEEKYYASRNADRNKLRGWQSTFSETGKNCTNFILSFSFCQIDVVEVFHI